MKTKKLSFLKLIFFLFMVLNSSYSYSKPRQDIIDFLENTGMFQMLQQGAFMYVEEVKKQHPDVPKEIWLEVTKNEMEQYTSSLQKFYIKIYSEHFTQEEMSKIIEFFQTPHGKKFQSLNAGFLEKIMEATDIETKKLQSNIVNRLKMNGYK